MSDTSSATHLVPYQPLFQEDVDPILKSRIRIWYPGQKNCERPEGEFPVLGRDYKVFIKAHILVMILGELQKTFNRKMTAHLNGSSLLKYVAPIYEKSNDHDAAVIITDPAEDKYRSFNMVDRIIRYVLGRLLSIEVSSEMNLKSLGLKLSPFNVTNSEHSLGSYSFEGEDSDLDGKKLPLELSIHSISHPDVPLHFTNLDLYIPLNLYRVLKKVIPKPLREEFRTSVEGRCYIKPVDMEVSRLGSIAADQFALFSKEIKKGEDISPVLKNIKNRIITSLLASNPLATSDPYQYARFIVAITDGLISLDSQTFAFFLNKGGSLVGNQIAKMVTWWADRKRDWIPNYKFFSVCTALMSCPQDSLLTRFFIEELSSLIQMADIDSSGLQTSWISFFQKLLEINPRQEKSAVPVLLRLFIPFFAQEIGLKKIAGKAQLQTKFQINTSFLHIPIPVLNEEESQGFPVSEQGDLPSPAGLLGDFRSLPLCRASLKEENLENIEKEKQIALEVLNATVQENISLACSRMITSELLHPEEISALIPFCNPDYLSADEITSLVPRLLNASAYASEEEIKNNLDFLNQKLLTRIPIRCKKDHCLEWMKGFFKEHQQTIDQWSELLWTEFNGLVCEFAQPTQPWKAFCISFTLAAPLKLHQEGAEFVLSLDKKTDNWPISKCPALVPNEERKSLYYLKTACLLKSVDSWRSFSYLYGALGIPELHLVIDKIQKHGDLSKEIDLFDFEKSLEKLSNPKEVSKALTLISFQSQLFGFSKVLLAYAKILPFIEGKEDLEMKVLEGVSRGLEEVEDEKEIAWFLYKSIYALPKVAEFLEDKFLLNENEIDVLSKAETDKERHQQALSFRLTKTSELKTSQMIARFLLNLKPEKEKLKLVFTQVLQKCKNPEEKLEVFFWVKKNFPSHMGALLELYRLHEMPMLHQVIWLLFESETLELRQRGWEFFVDQLEPLLKTVPGRSLEAINAYLKNATGEERAKLVFASTNLPRTLYSVANSLFLKSFSSGMDVSSFSTDFPWTVKNIQQGLEFILSDPSANSFQREMYVEGVIDKIPDFYYFSVVQKMIPHFNERARSLFSKKAQELLQGPTDANKWKENMAFFLSPKVLQIVSEDAELYHKVLNLSLKKFSKSRGADLADPLIATLLELVHRPMRFSCQGQLREEIQYTRMNIMLCYIERESFRSQVDSTLLADDIIEYLHEKPFQVLAQKMRDHNPVFSSVLLKQLIPHLNSSLDEVSLLHLLEEHVGVKCLEYIDNNILCFLAKYTNEMYKRFPSDQVFEYSKNKMTLCAKRGLSKEIETEEIWILKEHVGRLSQAIDSNLDKVVVEELFNIFSYQSCASFEIREGMLKAAGYVGDRMCDPSFMKLFEKEDKRSNGLSFFLLYSLRHLLRKTHVKSSIVGDILCPNISQIASESNIEVEYYDLIRFFARQVIAWMEIPESIKNPSMEPVVEGAVAGQILIPIAAASLSKCSKELLSILIKNRTEEDLEIASKLMLNIHFPRICQPDYSYEESSSFIFQDLEAFCLYLENVPLSSANQEVDSLIGRTICNMKFLFEKCKAIDLKRTNKLLSRLLNGIKRVCQEGIKTTTEFSLATAYLDWVMNPEELLIAEKFKQKDLVNLLLLRAYEANWSGNGFAIFTSLYMSAIEAGYGENLPSCLEVFTKSYENLMNLNKDTNRMPVYVFRDFINDIYTRCSGYNEGVLCCVDKVFFMKVLNQIARLTSSYDDVFIENLLAVFPKKDEILADWRSWKASNSVEL